MKLHTYQDISTCKLKNDNQDGTFLSTCYSTFVFECHNCQSEIPLVASQLCPFVPQDVVCSPQRRGGRRKQPVPLSSGRTWRRLPALQEQRYFLPASPWKRGERENCSTASFGESPEETTSVLQTQRHKDCQLCNEGGTWGKSCTPFQPSIHVPPALLPVTVLAAAIQHRMGCLYPTYVSAMWKQVQCVQAYSLRGCFLFHIFILLSVVHIREVRWFVLVRL